MFWLAVLVVSAAPKDCGAEFSCLADAAATCGPAVLRTTAQVGAAASFAQAFGAESDSETSYSLSPGKGGTCELKIEQKLLAVRIIGKMREQLKQAGKTDDEIAKVEKDLVEKTKGLPENDQRCVFEKPALEKALRQLPGTYDSKSWETCHPSRCVEPPPAIAKGCTWGKCVDGARSLSCKRGGKTVTCDPPKSAGTVNALSPGATAQGLRISCDKPGEPSFVTQ